MESQLLFVFIQSMWGFTLIIIMKITIFVIAYKIVKLGYELLSQGVQGKFKFSADFGGIKADLASVSPGLLFIVLGVMLIAFSLKVEKVVTTQYPDQILTEETKTKPPIDLELPLDIVKEK